jgi:hypothetical protein
MQDRRPIYKRGYDRAKAERIVTMFMHSYQPPPTCSHVGSRLVKSIDHVRGAFRVCTNPDCRMVVGVVR